MAAGREVLVGARDPSMSEGRDDRVLRKTSGHTIRTGSENQEAHRHINNNKFNARTWDYPRRALRVTAFILERIYNLGLASLYSDADHHLDSYYRRPSFCAHSAPS